MSKDALAPHLETVRKNIIELEQTLYGKEQINVAAVNRTTEDAIKALWRIRSAFGIV